MLRNTFVSGAIVVFLASLVGGCSLTAKNLVEGGQSQLVAQPVEAQLKFVQAEVEAFKRCLITWGGTCDARADEAKIEFVQPVQIFRELFGDSRVGTVAAVPELSEVMKQSTVTPAVRVLTSPTHQKLVDVFHFIAGQPGNQLSVTKSVGGVPQFKFTRQEFRDFSLDIEESHRFGAFQTIYAALDKAAKRLKSRTDMSEAEKSQLAKIEIVERMAAYLTSYLDAYFRSGEFASIVLDPSGLEGAIASRLQKSVPELDKSTLDTFVKQLADGVPKDDNGNYRLIGKVSETSFKTRGGADYKFPAITATLNPGSHEFISISKVDFVAVGGDLIRVFLEAIGDAMAGVPGVTDATGCKIKEEANKKDERLPVFDPNNQKTKLTTEEFGKVNDYATKVEGLVSSVIGRVVRGASWYSLNNESVAVLIETAIGVIVKKASEKVIWCGYCVAHKEGANVTERDPMGVTTLVPIGIGRRAGETPVSAEFVVVGGETLTPTAGGEGATK